MDYKIRTATPDDHNLIYVRIGCSAYFVDR